MNSQTEERLRAAFEAKADQVTAERLDQLAAQRQLLTEDGWNSIDDSGAGFRISAETDLENEVTPLEADRGPSRHARWFAPVLAAAAVVALAVGVTVISATRNDGDRRPALLGANQQADRSAIPWSQVDAGWTVALWTAVTLKTEQDLIPVRPQTVFLVNPIGGRYLITTLTGNFTLKLADWSTDVRTALLIRQGDKSSAVIRLDLSSGKTQSFTAAGRVQRAQFTKPSGAAILLEREDAGTERVSLTGTHQLTYPATRTTNFNPMPTYLLSSPDGRLLVLPADHGLVVRAENGALRRTIAPPAGTTTCSPLRWWDAKSVLAACRPDLGADEAQQLFVVPILTTGAATALAAPTAFDNPFTLAWRLDSGVLLLDKGGKCGGGVLGELDSTGHIVVRPIPAGLNGYGMNPVGSTGTTVTFVIQVLCGQSSALVSFNPATNQLTRLLGPGLNGGSVLDAYGFGSPNPQVGG
ncbi:MAG TPA: hypothetical protein VF714_11085 [Jatrophihabitans sp.]|jgi:TolB protein